MIKIFRYRLAQQFVIFLFFISGLNAQEQIIISSISGKVVDITTQQPLPGTNVWLLNTKYGAATDKDGIYTINNVPVGRYSITSSMMGYTQVTKSDIVVVPNRTTIINFELKSSPIEISAIVVRSEHFAKDLDDGVTSTVSIDRREISKTPGPPRCFQTIAVCCRSC